MKKIIIVMVLAIFLVACGEEPVQVSKTVVKNVKVETIESKSFQDYERYVGHITSAGILKKAFEVDGKIESIEVSIGDTVQKDQLLASVDTEGLQFALDAARAEYSASNAQYQKSLESLQYAKDLLSDMTTLYNQGVSTRSELDKVRLNYDVSNSDVNSARELRNQASTNIDVKEYMLKQSQIFASKDGIVVDVLVEAGELVGSGYPVLILRDPNPVVSFGIAQNDLQYVEIDKTLQLLCNDMTIEGKVISVNQIPDTSTQTYEVEVSISKDLPIGSIVSIDVPTVYVTGSKIPLGAIRSDGEDYVFTIENGYVTRTDIEVVAILNQEVIVSGLPDESILVVEGILGLTAGDSVNIVEE